MHKVNIAVQASSQRPLRIPPTAPKQPAASHNIQQVGTVHCAVPPPLWSLLRRSCHAKGEELKDGDIAFVSAFFSLSPFVSLPLSFSSPSRILYLFNPSRLSSSTSVASSFSQGRMLNNHDEAFFVRKKVEKRSMEWLVRVGGDAPAQAQDFTVGTAPQGRQPDPRSRGI
ncbi:hypothetical protein TESG_08391 [Trichophyton tonsurans CBS 112818]|uniref:Uncharacterized protein n=1 Tax=Trichophyton tonsurans (strain CBS 112818) TaxID=647933 RepID=F2RW32_TRIT1|nr:hypothetical protein TESG_08391 [Trichophyton tonsurans CBS 112818]